MSDHDYAAKFDHEVSNAADLESIVTSPKLATEHHDAGEYRESNTLRAALAGHTVTFYVRRGGGDAADLQASVVDLLSDVMHLCDALVVDFHQAVRSATNHYNREKAGL